jgi:hypothetical protein
MLSSQTRKEYLRRVRPGDRVRVVQPAPDAVVGAEGVLIGFYRRPSGDTVAVAFESGTVVLPIDAVELVEPGDLRE